MKKKISLTTEILIGLFLGFICGLILKSIPDSYIKDTIIIGGILKITAKNTIFAAADYI